MIVTATNKRLRVDYRLPGKSYGVGSVEVEVAESASQTKYPFESKDVEIGESFTVPENTFVQVVTYEATAPEADAPYRG